jgi:DNA-directed RNA polymerase II subunit RPB2
MKKEIRIADPNHPANRDVTNMAEMEWEVEESDAQFEKVFVGKVPLMTRSKYCVLHELSEQELTQVCECPYDQVAYSVIALVSINAHDRLDNQKGWLLCH